MNLFYITIAALLLVVIAVRFHLMIVDRHISFHSQSAGDDAPGRRKPFWREGRLWVTIYPNTDKGWAGYDPFGLRLEWHLLFPWTRAAFELTIANDDDDIQWHVALWPFGSVWLSFGGVPILHKVFDRFRQNFGYETGFTFHDGVLYIRWIFAEMWGTSHNTKKPWWQPRWIGFSKSSGYKEHPGVGWYITLDFDLLLLGGHERQVAILGKHINHPIPIFPDNLMGHHYRGTFTFQLESRWRSHFPFWTQKNFSWHIEVENPPYFPGKGENDYDMDDDAIFGTGSNALTLDEAVWDYVQRVYSYRKRRGMPSWYERVKDDYSGQ